MNDMPAQLEPFWDEQINALLDGELDSQAMSRLETAAADRPVLARALEDARQLCQLLGEMPAREAPAGLRRKLRRIPAGAESTSVWFWWRRAAFAAGIALLVVLFNPGGTDRPTELEIIEGRQDLALALSYLDRASGKTTIEIRRQISGAVVEPVTRSTLGKLRQEITIERENSL